MKERKEFRREREKHFENADHSFTASRKTAGYC